MLLTAPTRLSASPDSTPPSLCYSRRPASSGHAGELCQFRMGHLLVKGHGIYPPSGYSFRHHAERASQHFRRFRDCVTDCRGSVQHARKPVYVTDGRRMSGGEDGRDGYIPSIAAAAITGINRRSSRGIGLSGSAIIAGEFPVSTVTRRLGR